MFGTVWVGEAMFLCDASTPGLQAKKHVDAGRYDLEEIPNPFGHKEPWLVLKGTKVGMAKRAWEKHPLSGTYPIAFDQETSADDDSLAQILHDAGIPDVSIYSRALPQIRSRGFCDVLIPEDKVSELEAALATLPDGHACTPNRLARIRITKTTPAEDRLSKDNFVPAHRTSGDNGSNSGEKSRSLLSVIMGKKTGL